MVDSPTLAEDLAQVIERDIQAANAWTVKIAEAGSIYLEDSDEKVTRQSARDGM